MESVWKGRPLTPRFARLLPTAVAPRLRRWLAIYEAQAAAGLEVCTTLPEFGPATYVPIDPKTDEPIADIREVRVLAAYSRAI